MNDQSVHMDFSKEGERLGVTFHRTFSLVRPALMQVLQLANELGGNQPIDRKTIREKTNLGTIYVEAMPRYSFGSGLLDQTYRLTTFGSIVCQNDILLENLATQWLMHYHLSAPHGPGAFFWYELVRTRFRSGNEFTGEDIADQITEILTRTEDKPIAKRSARATATVFLGTYTKPEALGKLGILEHYAGDHYRVLEPGPPSAWVVGCALLELWQAQYKDLATIKLEDLLEEGGLASLFVMGAGRMNAALRELQAIGYVEVYRLAPPYQDRKSVV
jgi:hypothetical protein